MGTKEQALDAIAVATFTSRVVDDYEQFLLGHITADDLAERIGKTVEWLEPLLDHRVSHS